jgi:hypothetical protein
MAETQFLCCNCGAASNETGACPQCGGPVAGVAAGGVVALPSGSLPCPGCGADDQPVLFRGWSRLYAFVYWARETRLSAYLCESCARAETVRSLFITALLGWWSFPSLWRGPVATYNNWRAVWTAPSEPLEWGALRFEELFAEAHDLADDEEYFHGSPLENLSTAERALVLNTENPYETLGIDRDATDQEIKAAWRNRAKDSHPDLNPGDPQAAARMLELTRAYEVLGSPSLREAYDWLESSGRLDVA